MGKLRDKMDQDLRLRGLSLNTRKTYLRCARAFVKHYRKSPTEMGKAEVRDFLLHLVDERKLTAASYNVYGAALRFLFPTRSSGPRRWRGWARCASPAGCPRS